MLIIGVQLFALRNFVVPDIPKNCTQTALKIVHDGRNLKSVNCETLTPPVEIRTPDPLVRSQVVKTL